MKVTGKLAFLIVLLIAGIVFIYATTTPAQRGSATAYGSGWLAFKFNNYPSAVKHFTKSYDRDKNNLMALYFKAFSKIRVGETAGASSLDKHYFSEAVFDCKELVDKGKKADHKNLYLFYYIKARVHVNLKEWDAAEKNIELARKIVNDDYRILVMAGRVYVGKKDYTQAMVFLDDAIKIKNMMASEAYLYKGMAHEGLRQTDDAYKYYDKALDSWPSQEVKRMAIERKTNIVRN